MNYFFRLTSLWLMPLAVWSIGLPILAESSGLVPCVDDCNAGKLITLFNTIVNTLLFQVGIAVVTLVILWAGILYVLYPYKAGNKETAKKMLTGALYGLIIMLGAYVIVKFIVFGLVGGNTSDVAGYLKAIFQDIPNTTQN